MLVFINVILKFDITLYVVQIVDDHRPLLPVIPERDVIAAGGQCKVRATGHVEANGHHRG